MGWLAIALALWLAQEPAPAARGAPHVERLPAPPPSAPVTIALVRADGTLQPLARLEGEAWSAATAAAAAEPWRFWPFDDPVVRASPFSPRAARALAVTGPAPAGPGCLAASGIEPQLTAGVRADAVIGIALAGSDVRPDLPIAVPVDSDLGKVLAARAAAAFHRAEDETLTVEIEELPSGFPKFAARRTLPVIWTRIVRQGFAQGQSKTYYLEGRKDYEGFRGRTDIGRIRTTGHVFVRMSPSRETVDAEVDLSDLEGHQSIFRTPLVIVGWPERAVWLFDVQEPDGTHLEIMELMPGGGRPRSVWQGPHGCTRGAR